MATALKEVLANEIFVQHLKKLSHFYICIWLLVLSGKPLLVTLFIYVFIDLYHAIIIIIIIIIIIKVSSAMFLSCGK